MLSYSLFIFVHSYHIFVQPFLTLDTIVRCACVSECACVYECTYVCILVCMCDVFFLIQEFESINLVKTSFKKYLSS